jgi:hypothetical protein
MPERCGEASRCEQRGQTKNAIDTFVQSLPAQIFGLMCCLPVTRNQSQGITHEHSEIAPDRHGA